MSLPHFNHGICLLSKVGVDKVRYVPSVAKSVLLLLIKLFFPPTSIRNIKSSYTDEASSLLCNREDQKLQTFQHA